MTLFQYDLREAGKNALLVLLTILFVLGILETVLAFGVVEQRDRVGPKYKFCDGNSLKRFHPQYGWTGVPNSTYYRKESRYQNWSLYRINSEGFRDTYNSGEQNIILLGDSFAQGNLADDNATLPYLLDRWTPNTSIRAYANGGYSTAQELLIYENVSRREDHETVVLVYYLGNDATDNVEDRPKRPQFVVENGKLKQIHYPVNRSPPDDKPKRGPLYDLEQSLKKNTRSYEFLKPRVLLALDRLDLVETLPEPPQGERRQHQLTLTRYLISAVADVAQTNKAQLIIVTIPSRGEVNPRNPARFDPEEGKSFWSAQRQMLRTVASNRSHVSVLHTRSKLVAARESGYRVYGAENPHLEEYGYRVVAKNLYEYLAQSGAIRGGRQTFRQKYSEPRTPC